MESWKSKAELAGKRALVDRLSTSVSVARNFWGNHTQIVKMTKQYPIEIISFTKDTFISQNPSYTFCAVLYVHMQDHYI